MHEDLDDIIKFLKGQSASPDGNANGELDLRGEMILVKAIDMLRARVLELTAQRDNLAAQLAELKARNQAIIDKARETLR